ncbi:uncharacterized protein [Apostichopus japonicus]|uniref:uncharacterized protein isoform X2 n=1 Tax=Stichopus japonicus TaxID=307972 RepID=UPI003AB7C327
MQKELGLNFSQYIFVNVSALTAYLFGEMGKSLLIFCSVLIVISAFAGNGGLAFRTSNGDFSDVLDLLNERHEVQEPETEETEFDESEVETRDVVIPQTTIPENGGTYCHGEVLEPSEKYIVGFKPIVDNADVNHIALYGCLQGPSSQVDEWQCSGEETVCAGPSVLMFDWKLGECDDYLARGELITIGGRYIKHVVLVVGYEHGGYDSSSGLELKLMSTDLKDTPGLTKTVEYFSSSFNYVSKCPDVEPSLSSDEDDSSREDEMENEAGNESSEDNEENMEEEGVEEEESEEEAVDEEEEEEEGDGEEEQEELAQGTGYESEFYSESDEPSMALYESSLPTYDSSYSDGNPVMEYVSSLMDDYMQGQLVSEVTDDVSEFSEANEASEASEASVASEASETEYPYESSVEALINYLAEYWDEALQDTPSLTSTGWWPRQNIPVGQIAGLDVDARGNLVLFRRGERSWKPDDFDSDNVYIHDTPIQAQTLLVVEPMSGNIVEAWGKDRFYLPHGLTLDYQNNLWLTDVAMHQVFKISSDSDEPEMTFGQAFSPGSDADHLCKPTDVAVCSKTGDIFIADGYCNSRILKFAPNGTFLLEITAHSPGDDDDDSNSDLASFRIPHSLTMVQSKGWVCVADRENARIQCFNAHNGTFAKEFSSPEFGREVFAIAYSPVEDVLYAVNGPRLHRSDVSTSGFTFDLDSGEILDKWTPDPEHFGVLHDIAVSPKEDSVFVADIETNRVWRFEKSSDMLSNMIY